MNKVLVCITIQTNSKRLIEKGNTLATMLGAELHVLHIRQGNSIFDTPSSSTLFEELFVYGSELGGIVHFLCSDNVAETINTFICEHQFSHLVIGETNTSHAYVSQIDDELAATLENIDITVLNRQEY
ncbi:MAG: hypothetical protein ACRCSG_05655 [Cellulosilyticaceae bacterium]